MDPITIIIKTIFEIPKVIVKASCEAPKVVIQTGASGGILGILLGFVLLIMLCDGAIKLATDKVEDCIKSVNPNYVTSREKEKAEREKKERDKIKQEAEKPENINRNIRTGAEGYLRKAGYNFYAYDNCVISDHIWVCGNLFYNQNKLNEESHPVLLYSEDRGKNYKILFLFTEQNHWSHKSNIVFLNENEGFLLGYNVYKTENGGKNWETILSTKNIKIPPQLFEKFTVRDKNNISFVTGCGLMESHNNGRSWTHTVNGVIRASTHNNGLTWYTQE